MTSKERQAHREKIIYWARQLRSACKLELPPVPQFSHEPSTRQSRGTQEDARRARQRFITLLESWWDWLDLCRDRVEELREDLNDDYDWSPVNDIFGYLSRLVGINGAEFKTATKRLQERQPWTSKLRPVHSSQV